MNSKKKSKTQIIIIIATIVYALAIIPSGMFALFSPMMFDSPTSQENLITILLVIGIIVLPLSIVLSTIIAWILYAIKKYTTSVWVMSIPFINGLFVIVMFILLEVVCDGSFSC